ncbi:alpha/beta fold hydrolase [Pseudomaricurvus alkylphenolicus]|jgi:alpha/beta superfamily hydrolase|uniref:alpha/beta hydrolase n=1 Tax=Pseudomaricurvus alkylphenolicus TaxID=1306991 RepID=UPI00141D81ED|nr:alpha/beta fold hydrolase [Pseudomaricurvus alkylphenolicus]NIB41872.1 alpha/beta fold hydrolase [Pseudomaricurvus alkylphenolicus]
MATHIGEFTERESRMLLSGPAGHLEAVAAAPAPGGTLVASGFVAVVCHPHPLHGGTMDNKVVTTLARTYRDLGIPVVRFNFRGVGRSEGQFDDTVGEVQDLLAVVDWARACYPGRHLLLAGFSFGSSVAAQASHKLAGDLHHLVLVAPPVERYSYDVEGSFPCPVAVIMGEQDELVDVAGVFHWAQNLKRPAVVLRYPEATHFFHGVLVTVKQDLTDHLRRALG